MATQITNGDGVARVSALNCIDLSSSDTHQSVSLLKQACLDCWFFYLVNHACSWRRWIREGTKFAQRWKTQRKEKMAETRKQ
ncbi:hypothetical protein FF1_017072 [Malus domestica]